MCVNTNYEIYSGNKRGGCFNIGWDMLIFQLHFPHVISNSMQALHALSHSEITFRKTSFLYQHVSLKFPLMIGQPYQMRICFHHQLGDDKTSERLLQMTNQLLAIYQKWSHQTKQP